MKITLYIWRQDNAQAKGNMEKHALNGLNPDMSFLEMLDVLNEQIITAGGDPVEFDHDCREGICGQCGLFINGRAHGPLAATTTCQLHLRHFKDGDTIYVEPFRAAAFPVVKDLRIDRSAFDRIIQAGGYVSARTGDAPEANALPVPHRTAEQAFDAAACIGCGACVATCKNASAALFTAAKVSHLAMLPQGQPEREHRAQAMSAQMDEEGFGHCTQTGACEVECPQEISIAHIARMNYEFNRGAILKP
ncbi:succinate dehydrogenase/fumarate reductase iron-sulfur subunit [Phaeodactylibacter luteus]|uniref:Succinate dehydrogenase/fumarate reductase iron-sulfur subunit n=1 Tax=Phaeodactylibacter luteus TaxID=1564516 RepID=A0A5C6RPU2_9BACT|nr:succinate dehydrogenase/fumarate reductase iron-sulfur subunit [Phaeodactylibacter luteus]TXB64157.1 succinate dehydrogenase/fumarate reductase iron-sulfur subunit [Phaeodactylibacter luteus]